jgi:hypothetical protein
MGCGCKKKKLEPVQQPVTIKLTEPRTINVGLTDTQNDLVQKVIEKLQETQ